MWQPLGNFLKRQLVTICQLFYSSAYVLLAGMWKEAGREQTP